MRRRWLLALLLAGCHSNVEVDSSAFEGRSALLWIYVDGQLSGLWATNVGSAGLDPTPPGLAYERSVELLAMTFACPLQDVGLIPGAQTLHEFPEYDDPRTPPPKKLLAAKIEDGVQAPWKTLSEPDPRMQDALLLLDLPATNVCDHYSPPYRRTADVRIAATSPSDQPVFAQAIDDHRMLLGTSVGHLYEIADDGSYQQIEELGLGERPESIEFRAAFRDDSGGLWLYAADGRLAHGTLESGFEVLPVVSPATGTSVALTGSHGDAPFELFAVTNSHMMVRFDGAEWQTVYSGSEEAICDLGIAGGRQPLPASATWIAPGEALGLGAGEPPGMLLRYREGQAFEEPVPGIAGTPASVLSSDLGTFAGTCEGDLVRRGEVTWEPAFSRRAETSFPIVTMVRSGGGFLYAGFDDGQPLLATYHPSIGYCERDALEAFGLLVARAGPTIFVVYLRRNTDMLRVILLEEGDPPCLAAEG